MNALSQEALQIFQKVKKLQRIFLLINRESRLTCKIKQLLNENLKQYQSLSLVDILSLSTLNQQFLKLGKTLFLLSYLSSHKKVLVNYAIKFLGQLENEVKHIQGFKLDSFFLFEDQLNIFQKMLVQSLSGQTLPKVEEKINEKNNDLNKIFEEVMGNNSPVKQIVEEIKETNDASTALCEEKSEINTVKSIAKVGFKRRKSILREENRKKIHI